MANAIPLYIPPPVLINNASTNNFSLDASTDKIEWILQMPEAGTITKVAFRYGVRTGTPPTYKVTLQGVDGSGNSDGTDLGGGSPTSTTFTPPADATWNGTTREITLTNSYTCTRGQFIAVVLEYSSGTIDVSNFSSFTTYLDAGTGNFPYAIENNAGSRTRRAGYPQVALLTASKVYGWHWTTFSAITVHTASTPDEAGLLFTLPAGWGSTYQVLGVIGVIRFTNAAQTVRVTLYDTDGTTVLQQVDMDSDYTPSSSAFRSEMRIIFDEVTLATLSFGSTYRLTISVTAASGGIQLYYFDLPSSTYLQQYPLSDAAYWTQRTDAGAWTDTNTRIPLVGLILADWTEPAGSGGRGGLIF